MLERICSDAIFSNRCVCKHHVSGSLLPFPSPVLRNIPKYWQSCLFPWCTAFFLLNAETVTHWFWGISSSWKQKKILAPKHLVPSNFINYVWSLNTNRTSSYFLPTLLLFLNSTGFFAHWLGCCSWLRHQNKNTILLGCICERCFARPQAVKDWNQMGSSQMYTQRTFFTSDPGFSHSGKSWMKKRICTAVSVSGTLTKQCASSGSSRHYLGAHLCW